MLPYLDILLIYWMKKKTFSRLGRLTTNFTDLAIFLVVIYSKVHRVHSFILSPFIAHEPWAHLQTRIKTRFTMT